MLLAYRLDASGASDEPVALTLSNELRAHDGYVLSATFSPDGALLATTSSDRESVRLWSTEGFHPVRVLAGALCCVLCVMV